MNPDADRNHRVRLAGTAGLAGLASGALALWCAGGDLAWSALPGVTGSLIGWVMARPHLQAGAVADSVPPPATPEPPVAEAAFSASLVAGVIDNFALPLIVTADDATVLATSRLARSLFPGLARNRPVSLAIRDPDFLDAVTRAATQVASQTIVLGGLPPINRALRVHINRVTAAGSAEAAIISVFEDLSEQQATERMRMDFIANASHELRTPLASLLGFVETLQGPARDDVRARERFLPIMREQAARMARLIDDLLSLSRAELRAHQQPTALIDLGAIIREIMDSLSLSARERGVVLETALPNAPMLIRGDRDDLLRLVENLVENGIRYGRDGKVVTISLGRGAGGEAILSVRDHGPGIAAEHIPRLTERFYRADISHSRDMGGTGLGLAIVKHLVMRHRARLEIESRLGEGADFRVLFPPMAADS
jgi:two-component system phosphate regulon sensor histidine kinase PhoR